MKIEAAEHQNCFLFTLTAESIEDAALLVRFGLNRTKELKYASAQASEEGKFTGDICFGKKKNWTSNIERK